MTKQIPGVPESLTRAEYVSLFEAVGISPNRTLDLSFRPNGIYATVFVLDDNGAKMLDGSDLAKHSIYIPVED
jgi:hypothetical protein